MKYKIEIDGGPLNGAERYYDTQKAAIIAAKKIKPDLIDRIYIEVYYLDEKYKKHLIKKIRK